MKSTAAIAAASLAAFVVISAMAVSMGQAQTLSDVEQQYQRVCNGSQTGAGQEMCTKARALLEDMERDQNNSSAVPVSGEANSPPPGIKVASAGGAESSSQSSADRDKSFVGKPCAYFTRKGVEADGEVLRTNFYSNGQQVCYASTMYKCVSGVWADTGACTDYKGWQDVTAAKLESRPYKDN